MENESDQSTPDRSAISVGSGEQVVYVLPEAALFRPHEYQVDLARLWRVAWDSKWLVIGISFLIVALAVAYALLQTRWYRAEVLLAPAEEKRTGDGLAGRFSGLIRLAGISVGGGGNAEAIAILRSREFIATFIKDENLLPILFEERWNAEKNTWKSPEHVPDIREAVRFFTTEICFVNEDPTTQLVTLAVEWRDPELAAKWGNLMAERLNTYMRQRALDEAGRNLEYLRSELEATDNVVLRQSIGRLLEVEVQKMMLARGNDEFAFRVIDRAQAPISPSRPNRTLMVLLSVLIAGLVSTVIVFVRYHRTASPRMQ